MDFPNLEQMSFVLKNDTDFRLDKLLHKDYFIVAFVEHLKEYFEQIEKRFSILIPLLDPSFGEEQLTTIALDGVELGDFHLLNNSVNEAASLVYSSTSGLLETSIVDFSIYEELHVSDYLLLLHEFSSMIVGESILYKEIKKD